MAMNVVVTTHLPVYLYSVAGEKVNRQVAHTRWTVTRTHWMVDNSAPGRWITKSLLPTEWWAIHHLKYFNRFSATSLGKVFFGSLTFQSLWDFFADRARYENQSSTVKGLLLGACFVAEGPPSKNTFGKLIQADKA
jgi:hypothetical protein